MDEWWPLLYRTRATGKPGANVFEMQLRPEVEEAFLLIDEQEKQAKRAENARQLQRIEQLERARREERERRAAQAKAEAEEAAAAAAAVEEAAVEATSTPEPTRRSGLTPSMVRTVGQITGEASTTVVVNSEAAVPTMVEEFADDAFVPTFAALNNYLDVMAQAANMQGGSRFVMGDKRPQSDAAPFDAAGPLDYALRYAERLRGVLALMREGNTRITAAAVARAVGDKSVSNLQDILNGQKIPDFDYLDGLKSSLLINPDYLEAPDGQEEGVPVFCTYQELLEQGGDRADLNEDTPQEISYVVDDSRERRTGVILRFTDLRCVLLSRVAVEAETKRDQSDKLDAFVRMVDELDAFARNTGILRTSRQISSDQWDKLVDGRLWPGSLM